MGGAGRLRGIGGSGLLHLPPAPIGFGAPGYAVLVEPVTERAPGGRLRREAEHVTVGVEHVEFPGPPREVPGGMADERPPAHEFLVEGVRVVHIQVDPGPRSSLAPQAEHEGGAVPLDVPEPPARVEEGPRARRAQ
jgi:hypothetical protein